MCSEIRGRAAHAALGRVEAMAGDKAADPFAFLLRQKREPLFSF